MRRISNPTAKATDKIHNLWRNKCQSDAMQSRRSPPIPLTPPFFLFFLIFSPQFPLTQFNESLMTKCPSEKQNPQTKPPLDRPRRANVPVNDIIEVIAHGDKKVKEQLAATSLHLSLHGTATLKRLAAADDESQVMSP